MESRADQIARDTRCLRSFQLRADAISHLIVNSEILMNDHKPAWCVTAVAVLTLILSLVPARGAESTAALAAPGVIFDTDMGSDCDDAGALAVLHALADAGELRILGVIFSSGRNRYGVGTCDAINTYYGRGDLPLGQYQGTDVGDPADSYTKRIATDTECFGHDIVDRAPDLVTVYRSILESQPDRSVTICTVGHPHGLVHLLRDSQGAALIRAKVDRWVAMGMGGWNFEQMGMAAYFQELLEAWPKPFYVSPSGEAIKTGHRLLPRTPETNPVREAYRLWNQGTAITEGRSSWDQVAVLFIARPHLFTVERSGQVERSANGRVVWNASVDNPNHSLVTPTLPSDEMAGIIEELMARPPKSPPSAAATIEGLETLVIDNVAPPPEWALLQRHLLDQLHPAALEFVRKYTRSDGTLIWRETWPGMDGSDDGYESFYNFPLYYALGGPEEIHRLSRKLWDAATRQFTRYGQIYDEFDAYYDWMHHGESYTYFYFFGLADPTVRQDRERALRFAGLYLGENPEAPNWDAERKLIRSPINGSRGPRFVNTAEDWVTHRSVLAHYPLPYDDIPGVTDSGAWNDDAKFPFILQTMNERMMRGDVPLNLTATSLILNAYCYTGDPKYRRWIEDYVSAWMQRAARNHGILPDNVGLNDAIGEYMDGKWWGGYYGWRWPHGLFNQLEATLIGAANAQLVTGDAEWLELPRSVFDLVESQATEKDGRLLVPHRHGDQGWYDHRRLNPQHPAHLWWISRDPRDLERIRRHTAPADWEGLRYAKGKGDSDHPVSWLGFLEGRNPGYPAQILQASYGETLRRLARIRADRTTPDEQDVHHWQQLNPVVLEGLVQLMLGGPNHIYHGGLLHVSVRYFDPVRRRPGVPPEVAALVDGITADGITVQVVNLSPTETRDVILQAGAFGEHQITRARELHRDPRPFRSIDRKFLQVRLPPAAQGRLELDVNRYQNRPSYAFPWHGEEIPIE